VIIFVLQFRHINSSGQMGAKQENGDPENILPPIEQVIRFFDLQGNDLALDVEKGCL